MSTPARLLLFGIGLVVIFGVTFFAGRALVPEETVTNWVSEAEDSDMDHESPDGHGSESGHQAERPIKIEVKAE